MIQTLTQIVGIGAVIMTAIALFVTFFVWKASQKIFSKFSAIFVATIYSAAKTWVWPIILWVAFYFLNHKW